MAYTSTSTIEAPRGEWIEVRKPIAVGDVVCLYDGGQPMTRLRVGESADVVWHSISHMLQDFTRLPLAALRPYQHWCTHPDTAHDRAVELAEAGATKVTVSGSPVILIFGIVAGLLLAAAWGAV
jgi:hypothetical protein